MNPFFLILISAASNATFNILLKTALSKIPKTTPFTETMLYLIKGPYLWVCGSLFIIAFTCYTLALQKVNLSIAYPLLVSAVSLTVITASLIFLNETLTLTRVGGISLLLIGVWLIAR